MIGRVAEPGNANGSRRVRPLNNASFLPTHPPKLDNTTDHLWTFVNPSALDTTARMTMCKNRKQSSTLRDYTVGMIKEMSRACLGRS